ncbi:MAG: hypothetical protein ACTSXO_11405 [Candidatus Heimdallarchaeota archaeon]
MTTYMAGKIDISLIFQALWQNERTVEHPFYLSSLGALCGERLQIFIEKPTIFV